MTQASDSPDISILIVNWRSGELTRALVDNLREQRFTGADGEQGTLEFIVTDNTCDTSEEVHLEALEADGVTVIRSRQNSGYAMGMNLAVEKAKGRFILISNPDVLAFRGALAAMKEHLESHEGCGVVGPKGYLDAKRFFQLPPVDLPSLCELFSETLARAFRGRGRRHAEARTRRAIKAWTATDPVSRSMVSGFCMLMRTDLARELGPFDAGYPFYYEDADLCLRLHRRGFTTDLVPRAQMVHFFNRSAGQAQELAWSRYAVSKRRFFRRRYGLPGQVLYDLMNAFTASRKGQGHLFAEVEDLGEQSAVPEVGVPGSGPYLAEISADPGFVFAAGRLDVQRRFTVPADVWDGLAPAPYYLRFLHRGTWRIERTVKITKVAAPAPRAAEPVAAVTSEA